MRSTTGIAEEKERLRGALREEERRLTRAALSASDRLLAERFLALPEVAQARTVLLFRSMGAEPDTGPLLAALLERGKRVALPRCLPGGRMEARQYLPGIPLVRHRFGMLEPGLDHPLLEPEEIDLALVPAQVYDVTGMRLGRGGGYYDRYLAAFPGRTIGLCRDALLRERVPAETHDRPVELVLTETRRFRRREETPNG